MRTCSTLSPDSGCTPHSMRCWFTPRCPVRFSLPPPNAGGSVTSARFSPARGPSQSCNPRGRFSSSSMSATPPPCPTPYRFRRPSPTHSQFFVEQRMANSTKRLRMGSGMAFESTSANSALSTPVKSSQRIPVTCSVCRNARPSKRSAKPF